MTPSFQEMFLFLLNTCKHKKHFYLTALLILIYSNFILCINSSSITLHTNFNSLSNLRQNNKSIISKDPTSGTLLERIIPIDVDNKGQLPLSIDTSHELLDASTAKQDASAAFCFEFSNILKVEDETLLDCIQRLLQLLDQNNTDSTDAPGDGIEDKDRN